MIACAASRVTDVMVGPDVEQSFNTRTQVRSNSVCAHMGACSIVVPTHWPVMTDILTILVHWTSRTERGRGGGVPSELFQPKYELSQTVQNEAFEQAKGELVADALGRASVDCGLYGSDHQTSALFEDEELQFDSLHTSDPLENFPVLCNIRETYLSKCELQYECPYTITTPVSNLTDFDRMYTHVQDYMHVKEVTTALLICAAQYALPSLQEDYDWVSFVTSASPGSSQHQLRTCLKACAQL